MDEEPQRRAGNVDDAAVEQLLGRFEELVDRVEQVPGPTAEAAMEAVQVLAEVYGEALTRVVERADAELVNDLADDELVGHLMVLHGLHPAPVEQRVSAALSEASTYLGDDGSAELTGIDAGVANIKVMASGCGSQGAVDSVADVVVAAAPELRGVDAESAAASTPVIPVDSLLQRVEDRAPDGDTGAGTPDRSVLDRLMHPPDAES